MRNTIAIMQRELLSLFCSPIGYIVISGFLLITGVIVLMTKSFSPGQPATLAAFFYLTPFVLTIIVPAITMRAISDEYRSGTIETLMTAPVSDAQLVVGKFLASLVFYVIMIAATLIYPILISMFGRADWGAAASSYVGLLLMGATFIAFGVMASSLTRNQVVAWIAGAVPLLLLAWLAYYMIPQVSGALRTVFQEVNVMGRFEAMTKGAISLSSAVFFVGGAVLFLFIATKIVESKRWR
ncbi:MAG: ABC transporter permease subunit [Phycisphaerales bacterium]|nr:ABC transporter permease subunit [Phycisphaerales bacterium]